jgi:hypothetical protein
MVNGVEEKAELPGQLDIHPNPELPPLVGLSYVAR